MEKIHIVADSASDISVSESKEYGIEILPVSVEIDDKILREFYDITPVDYWDILECSEKIPKTAQITPVMWYDSFKAAKDRGCTHVIAFIINSNGSGSFQSARMAKELFYGEEGTDVHIELIDSLAYSFVYGHVAINASKMLKQGKSFDEIMNDSKKRLSRCMGVLGVYTLKYLKKSGRISGGAAFVGEALGLRPISLVGNGGVNVCDKVRGDKNVVTKIIERVKRHVVDPHDQPAYIMCAKTPHDEVIKIEKELLKMGFSAVERHDLGVSITTNAGPNSIAVIFYGDYNA